MPRLLQVEQLSFKQLKEVITLCQDELDRREKEKALKVELWNNLQKALEDIEEAGFLLFDEEGQEIDCEAFGCWEIYKNKVR